MTVRARGWTQAATGDLRLEALSKRFGAVLAVDQVSLHVPRGSFFALLGPSGCGKSTTLRMVAGLDQPTSGRVLIGEADLTGTRPHERPVNTVFQSYALFPHLSVVDNVAFGPRRRREPNAEGRARQALELVQMHQHLDRRPGQLSGGQQQRVALARALVNRPEVLLLDEPLGALDLKLRRQMQVELKRLQQELGMTFLHVTHDQDEALTLADTVALMNGGRLQQMGSPQQLYDLPRTAFAATFLGQSNLVPGLVCGADGVNGAEQALVSVAGRTLAVPRARCAAAGPALALGVRPEKLALSPAEPNGSAGPRRNVLGPGHVRDVSFTGVSTEYLVELPHVGTWSVFAQNRGLDGHASPGDQVWVSWDPRHTFALPGAEDPGTGGSSAQVVGLAPGRRAGR